MDSPKDIQDIKDFLAKPVDLIGKSLEAKAGLLTLHFIGYIPKPVGLAEGIYERCLEAFNANRGKTELEEAAVFKALKGDVR